MLPVELPVTQAEISWIEAVFEMFKTFVIDLFTLGFIS